MHSFRRFIAPVTLGIFLIASPISANAKIRVENNDTLFDPTWYAEEYPDVSAALGNDENALFSHFENCGREEGRSGYNSLLFDPEWYAQKNPDIAAALGTDEGLLYQHYVQNGLSENRQAVNPDAVAAAIRSLKSRFPEGMPFDNSVHYVSSAVHEGGYGCHAFALEISDLVFGKDANAYTFYDPKQIRAGSIVRLGDYHTVVILSVDGDGYTVCEGNYNGKVHWEDHYSFEEMNRVFNYGILRY